MSAWESYNLVVIGLFLKFFAVSGVQGFYRLKHKTFVRPEDADFFGKGAQPAAEELPLVQRAQNVLRNDLENIPFFLFLLLGYIQIGGGATGVLVYGGLFLLTRIIHTAAYLRPTQPLRNRAYLGGILVLLILSGQILAHIFRLTTFR